MRKEKCTVCLENSKEQNVWAFLSHKSHILPCSSKTGDEQCYSVQISGWEIKDIFWFQVLRYLGYRRNLEILSLHFTQSFTKSSWVWGPSGDQLCFFPPPFLLPPALFSTVHSNSSGTTDHYQNMLDWDLVNGRAPGLFSQGPRYSPLPIMIPTRPSVGDSEMKRAIRNGGRQSCLKAEGESAWPFNCAKTTRQNRYISNRGLTERVLLKLK